MKRRALLLCGGIRPKPNPSCCEGDVRAYYRLLRDKYGYPADEVRICMGAGSPLNLGGVQPISAMPAGQRHVRVALGWLAELGEEDRAFLLVTDHGGPDGITLWGKGEFLSPEDLARALAPSPATKVIVLGQCYGGIFSRSRPCRAVICSASDTNAYSRPPSTPGVEPAFMEFLYQFAGALAGQYPDGSPLEEHDEALRPPGQISIGEAFHYARSHDRWVTGTRTVAELPKMFDPEGLADKLTL